MSVIRFRLQFHNYIVEEFFAKNGRSLSSGEIILKHIFFYYSNFYRVYMIDGIYQSVMCFFMTYFLFADADAVTRNGLDLSGREQMGVYVASSAIVVVNVYILINQYRWDWVFGLCVSLSILCIWLWTLIFSAFTSTGAFHTTSNHVYGALSFWAVVFLTTVVCLLPRMAAKTIQKLFFPLDTDIIREQVMMGKFDYLEKSDDCVALPQSTTEEIKATPIEQQYLEEDERPIYPPSVAPTATTAGKRGSGNGSDGTDGSGYPGTGTFTPRFSMDRRQSYDMRRVSTDRPRHSVDRVRMSMDRARPSFEATNDFTTAAMLARMECSHTYPKRMGQMTQVHSHE